MRFPLRISDQSEDKQATSVVSHHHPNIQFLRCHGVFFPEKKTQNPWHLLQRPPNLSFGQETMI